MSPRTWGIVLAAGEGRRLGRRKQFERAAGRRLVDFAVDVMIETCSGVVVVLPEDSWDGSPVDATVTGGATRAASVRRGLAAVPADVEYVVIHDGAHPLASAALVRALLSRLSEGFDAVAPIKPLTDPLKRVADGRIVCTIPRDDVWMTQISGGLSRRGAARRVSGRSRGSAGGHARRRSARGRHRDGSWRHLEHPRHHAERSRAREVVDSPDAALADRNPILTPSNSTASAVARDTGPRQPHFVIQPSHGWVSLKLRELWEYRELLYFLTWRDIKVRYKQTVLGAAWAIIQPFFTMVVFSLFFGRLAKMPSDGVPYPLFASPRWCRGRSSPTA